MTIISAGKSNPKMDVCKTMSELFTLVGTVLLNLCSVRGHLCLEAWRDPRALSEEIGQYTLGAEAWAARIIGYGFQHHRPHYLSADLINNQP